MKYLKFKTNINCSGCIAKVTPFLDSEKGINDWELDTQNPEKILTVETESLNADQVKDIVKKVGFSIEELV